MNINRFQERLTVMVKPYTPDVLLWPSESDYPVEVVRLNRWQTRGWDWQAFDASQWAASNACQSHPHWRRWHALRYDGMNASWQQHKRPTEEPGVCDLYVMVRFGWWRVGLKTKVVETG